MQIDNLAAETAAYLTTKHPDFAVLAARIAISNLYKETKEKFSGKLFPYLYFKFIYYLYYIMLFQMLFMIYTI